MTISRKQTEKPVAGGPNERQSQAADPLKSVWVGASAGTGKTKVLIDRVLRLMLPRPGQPADSASRPEKILCLTFTKTAAAEMSNRIYRDLAAWATMSDADLDAALETLTGLPPTPDVVRTARRLFARVLDTPGGLKIMTLHSFCQSVLKRFPIEAGLPPHFELMDEASAVEYLTRCMHDLIGAARAQPGGVLAQSFDRLVLHLDPETMSDLMAKIMAGRSQLAAILRHFRDEDGQAENTVAAVYDYLDLPPGVTEEALFRNFNAAAPERDAALRRAMDALLQGSATDQKRGAVLADWLARPADRQQMYRDYRLVYFTTGDAPRAKMSDKAAAEILPDIGDILGREMARVAAFHDRLTARRLAELNAALLTVSAEMVGRYERYKRDTDRLDFDDLIIKTRSLLAEEGMVNWVLYKLDEGIDHILVDEAQDTSPAQWHVVRALAGDFFAGMGRSETRLRTLFVVGDEKQSIFSFQGADPSEFARMQDFFGGRVRAVQEGWEVLLEHSFRSTHTVLEIVDSVFAPAATRQGVVADLSREVRHVAARVGQAGLVELWPLLQPQQKNDVAPWKMPLDVEPGDNAASRLAQKIAETIRGWLDSGEKLPSKDRAIRPGDILILMQSRGAFVETILRALKQQGIPVAGIDRMTLTEELAVMDLLAAAAFSLQTRDDLTLATLLKSPLVGLTEEELFDLCHGRRGTLWATVKTARPDIAASLSPMIERAGYATPYEFFAEILNAPCFADKVSGRRAFYARLGFDIHDPLDELLNSCLHYEQSHTPSLQKFVDWFTRGEAQIKREQDQQNADQVRIMTVHASKGLQAPIVFLPDTVKKLHDHNKGRVRLLWPPEDSDDPDTLPVPLWSPRAEFDADSYARLRSAAAERQEEEYRRLLYVALTRAEDRLYICGYQGKKPPKPDCWYNLVAESFPAAETHPFMTGAEGEALMLRRLSHPQTAAPKPDRAPLRSSDASRAPLPAWAQQAAGAEPTPPTPLAPSRPDEEEPPVSGPLSQDESWKFRRGNIVHRVLETLPQLPPDSRLAALRQYLARKGLQLPAETQDAFADEIMAVVTHPEFAPIFGAGSQAEVPVVGLLEASAGRPPRILSGQIDRLLVTENEVLIVDYKTNRPPPQDAEGVPVIYLKQMAAYKAVLSSIYPGRAVKCALLWTDIPLLMPLPDALLDRYLPSA